MSTPRPPQYVAPKSENIPAELREATAPRWVCWRYARARGRITKVPYVAAALAARKASSTDPATWRTFAEAWNTYERGGFDGVGFVLDGSDGLAGLDLDKCIDPETGELSDLARETVDSIASYTELSPSGLGLRILARGSLPKGKRTSATVEMYAKGRYLTLTGAHLDGTPLAIEERTAAMAALHARFIAEGDRSSASNGIPLGGIDINMEALAHNGTTRRAQAALGKECARVAAAREGERNNVLTSAAFSIGQLVARGELPAAEAEAALIAAAIAAGLPEPEATDVTRRQIAAGGQHPRADAPRVIPASKNRGAAAATGGAPLPEGADAAEPTEAAPEPPPRLDLDAALPQWLAADVRALAAWVQIAHEVVATCLLVYCSGAIGYSRELHARGLRVVLSLHVITALPSGSGKSEIRKYIRSCIKEIERKIRERRKEASAAAEEYELGLTRWKRATANPSAKRREGAGARPEPPHAHAMGGTRATYTLSEGTLEGVLTTLADCPRGVLWTTDEADTVIGMLGAYADGRRALDAARLREITESQPVETHLSKSNATPLRIVRHPWLALEADVQPGILAGCFAAADHHSGTIARLLIHAPPPMQGSRQYVDAPPEPGEGVHARLRGLLEGLWSQPLDLDLEGAPEPRPLVLRPAAEATWAEECERLEAKYAGASETEYGILGHLRGRLLRLAGVLALIRDPAAEAVTDADMARAVTWGRYFLGHARALWGRAAAVETPEERQARELVEYVTAHAGCTPRDVAAGMRRFRDAGEGRAGLAAAALDALATEGRIVREAGPRTTRYHPRPHVPVRTSPAGIAAEANSGDGDTGTGGHDAQAAEERAPADPGPWPLATLTLDVDQSGELIAPGPVEAEPPAPAAHRASRARPARATADQEEHQAERDTPPAEGGAVGAVIPLAPLLGTSAEQTGLEPAR